MSKKSERANRKKSEIGNKGSIMSGDDSKKSKSPVNVNLHENRTIQKSNSNK